MGSIEKTVAIAGFDCRIDEDGRSHPWRMIAWRETSTGDVVVRRIGSLPDGLRWLSIPRDPLYGDLQALSSPPLAMQTHEIAGDLVEAGMHALLVADMGCSPMLFDSLRWHGIEIKEVEGYMEKAREIASRELQPRTEFPGEAGREIANIRNMTEVSA
jgi:hypothetical protein